MINPGDIDAHNSWFIANGYFGRLSSCTIETHRNQSKPIKTHSCS